ncbi:MAG TPA: DUF4352 domain-containing protein [Candidatus Saccharimonadales bacterium]
MSKDKSGNWFRRHKILTVILGIIVLVVIVKATGGSKPSTTASNKSTSNTQTKTPTLAKIGQAADDGKFEFTVASVKCGQPSVSDSSGYVTKSAQGQYCLMTVSVKNIGDKQQLFSESDQKLLNATSQQYSPDTTATLYNDNNTDAFLSEINPGNTVTGVLVYDIPKDQTPITAELHDSSLSNGVKVNLQ